MTIESGWLHETEYVPDLRTELYLVSQGVEPSYGCRCVLFLWSKERHHSNLLKVVYVAYCHARIEPVPYSAYGLD